MTTRQVNKIINAGAALACEMILSGANSNDAFAVAFDYVHERLPPNHNVEHTLLDYWLAAAVAATIAVRRTYKR